MWTVILVGAIVASVEPARLGLTVLMLSRRKPLLQLSVFLCGALAVGLGMGLMFLFLLRTVPVVKPNISAPRMEMLFGLLMLVVAALVAAAGLTQKDSRPPSKVTQSISTRMGRILKNNSLWVAGMSGMAVAVPQANSLAMIGVIYASGAAEAVQVTALLVFNVVAFSMVALPLIGCAAMPGRTYAMLSAMHTRVRSLKRSDVAVCVAVLGLLMFTLGTVGLVLGSGDR